EDLNGAPRVPKGAHRPRGQSRVKSPRGSGKRRRRATSRGPERSASCPEGRLTTTWPVLGHSPRGSGVKSRASVLLRRVFFRKAAIRPIPRYAVIERRVVDEVERELEGESVVLQNKLDRLYNQ